MASTFILKRKTFSDPQQQKNSSFGKKLAIGAGTVAGTAGLFLGARKGVMGNQIMKSANNLYGRAGGYLSRNGATNIGNKMMTGARKDYLKATQSTMEEAAKAKGKTLADGVANKKATAAADAMKQKWTVGKTEYKAQQKARGINNRVSKAYDGASSADYADAGMLV